MGLERQQIVRINSWQYSYVHTYHFHSITYICITAVVLATAPTPPPLTCSGIPVLFLYSTFPALRLPLQSCPSLFFFSCLLLLFLSPILSCTVLPSTVHSLPVLLAYPVLSCHISFLSYPILCSTFRSYLSCPKLCLIPPCRTSPSCPAPCRACPVLSHLALSRPIPFCILPPLSNPCLD